MPVFACGSNAFRQLADVDDLIFEDFVEVRTPSDAGAATSLLGISWSQTLVSKSDDSVAVLGVHSEAEFSEARHWLGQEAFVAALLEDGRLIRLSDQAKSTARYAHADMNGRGELLLVPEETLGVALLFESLHQVFAKPAKCQVLRLPSPESALPASSASSSSTRHDEQVTALASGAAHFLLLSSAGRVFSYGDNRYGQTGPFSSSPFPASASGSVNHLSLFDGLFPISVSCGAFHSVVVTRDRSAYTFGSNKDGQRGGGEAAHGSGDEPELLELVSEDAQSLDEVEGYEEEVEQVACGAAHTVVLTRSGRIWCAGANSDGQLGLRDRNARSEWTENRTLEPVLWQKQLRIKRIACSRAATYLELKRDPAAEQS